MKILQGFADRGVECEALSAYGDVTRATIEPHRNDYSTVVKADLSRPDELPFAEGEFDLAVLHPPCTKWSDMPDADKDEDAPDLIDEAREIGRRYANHYVVENKPAAPLRSPTVLDGRMFGLPIKYERAFETSFVVEQPPRTQRLGQPPETSSFYFSERTTAWWRAAKGNVRGDYPKQHIAKNTIPLPFITHLCRSWLDGSDESQGVADYSEYDAEMDEKRARANNAELGDFA